MTSSQVVLGNKIRKICKICLSAELPIVQYLILSKPLSRLIFQHEINNMFWKCNFFSKVIIFCLLYKMHSSAFFALAEKTFSNAIRSELKLLLTILTMPMNVANTLLIIMLISGCFENSFQSIFNYSKGEFERLINVVNGKYAHK